MTGQVNGNHAQIFGVPQLRRPMQMRSARAVNEDEGYGAGFGVGEKMVGIIVVCLTRRNVGLYLLQIQEHYTKLL